MDQLIDEIQHDGVTGNGGKQTRAKLKAVSYGHVTGSTVFWSHLFHSGSFPVPFLADCNEVRSLPLLFLSVMMFLLCYRPRINGASHAWAVISETTVKISLSFIKLFSQVFGHRD